MIFTGIREQQRKDENHLKSKHKFLSRLIEIYFLQSITNRFPFLLFRANPFFWSSCEVRQKKEKAVQFQTDRRQIRSNNNHKTNLHANSNSSIRREWRKARQAGCNRWNFSPISFLESWRKLSPVFGCFLCHLFRNGEDWIKTVGFLLILLSCLVLSSLVVWTTLVVV